eukprot:COSAG03_NODE_27740_length_251_cov_1.013158_1_plen_35_part_10
MEGRVTIHESTIKHTAFEGLNDSDTIANRPRPRSR